MNFPLDRRTQDRLAPRDSRALTYIGACGGLAAAVTFGAVAFYGGAIVESTGGIASGEGTVVISQPGTPSISSIVPLDTSATLNSTAFNGSGGDTHASTDWQIERLAGDWSVPVFDSAGADVALVSIADAGAQGTGTDSLKTDTIYKARVRHNGTSGGASTWSDSVQFTAAATSFAFEALWNNSTGTSNAAITNGSQFDFIGNSTAMEVFGSGPQSLNYLRIPVEDQVGGNPGREIAALSGRPLPTGSSHEFWQRVYMRVNQLDPISPPDHGHEISSTHYWNMNFLSRENRGTDSSTWTPGVDIIGPTNSGAHYPLHRWEFRDSDGNNIFLNQEQWYRIEHHVVLTLDTGVWYITTFEVRIVDASTDSIDDLDVAIYDEADFWQQDYSGSGINLRTWQDTTVNDTPPSLGRRAIERPDSVVDTFYTGSPYYWNVVHVGYNGQSGWDALQQSGASFDWAGYAISLSAYPGAHN